jgi:hypothetical protein
VVSLQELVAELLKGGESASASVNFGTVFLLEVGNKLLNGI